MPPGPAPKYTVKLLGLYSPEQIKALDAAVARRRTKLKEDEFLSRLAILRAALDRWLKEDARTR
jgi:hypothetical protein